MELEQKLGAIESQLQKYIEKAAEEQKTNGAVQAETKAAVEKIQTQFDALVIEMKKPKGGERKDGLEEAIKADSKVAEMIATKRGRATIEFKGALINELLQRKTITESGFGFSTTGVMPEERDSGIVPIARPSLRMRSVLPSRPTSVEKITWIKETVRPTKASPVAENALKPASDLTLAADYEYVRKIALVMVASDEVLADYSELLGFLRSELAARVREEEDRQLLYGDATGENLNGLTTQAQAFDIGLLSAAAGYTYIDTISAAMQQVAEDNEVTESPFIVMHPRDVFKLRRTKDEQGRYLLGDPNSPNQASIWGAPIVDTTILTVGKFLLGHGTPRAAEIRDRMGVTIDLSTEDGDNFRYNRVTIRAEMRLALVVKRPDAFVYGDLAASPA